MISKQIFSRDYLPTINLAIPVVLSQVGQVIVQLVDNAMVGVLGSDSLAAVSFAGALFFVFFLFCGGMSMGLTPLVGEMYSKGSHRISAIYLQNSVVLYTLLSLVVFALMRVVGGCMHLFGQEEAVVELARPYFNYVAWSIIPFMIFGAFKQFLEGLGNTKVAMVIVLTSNVINIFFNYLLIYGNWGFEAMGAAGAGLATLISRIITPILIVSYFANKEKFRRYFALFNRKNLNFEWIKSLVKVGLPISLQLLMEGGVFSIVSIMMGWIGSKELAANQIALSMANFAFMIVLGVGAATTIRISHAYGRRDFESMRNIARSSLRMGIVYNVITALIFIFTRNYIPLIFTDDARVVEIASLLLICVAVWQFSDGLQIITQGVLRGVRDMNTTVVIAFISYILVTLPVGYTCAFVFGMSAPGLWVGFIIGLGLAAVLLSLRWRKVFRQLRQSKE